MKLNPIPFVQIQKGQKTIELRLFDEKRQTLKIGDHILFCKLPELTETLQAEIVRLVNAPNFKQLLTEIDISDAGFNSGLTYEEMASEMSVYYSSDQQTKYGVLAIYLKF